MKYLYALCTLLFLTACNVSEIHDVEEDYAQIFKEKEIEKPEVSSIDAVVRQGDPNVTKSSFRYEGTDTNQEGISYTVVVKYRLGESREDLNKSRYYVRFVNEKKELVSLFSNANTHFMPYDEYSPEAAASGTRPEFKPNKEYTLRFQAQSGFQLFLCVTGAGPRNSNIRASITATDNAGLMEPIVLQTEQYQQNEGQASLPKPYCKYVLLP